MRYAGAVWIDVARAVDDLHGPITSDDDSPRGLVVLEEGAEFLFGVAAGGDRGRRRELDDALRQFLTAGEPEQVGGVAFAPRRWGKSG